MQKELNDHSSELEALRTQLISKEFLSEEELRAQALVEIEEARQKGYSTPKGPNKIFR